MAYTVDMALSRHEADQVMYVHLQQNGDGQRVMGNLQDAPWLPDKPVMQVWAEFAHVAVIAHQRRGESDAVAFWMYQLMALDTMAEEWQQVMQPSVFAKV